MAENIELKTSNMRKWKVRHNSMLMWWDYMLWRSNHKIVSHCSSSVPNEIIVTKHYTFRVTGCSTSVYQTAAHSWLLLHHKVHNSLIRNISSNLHKILESKDSAITIFTCWKFFFTIDNKCFDLGKFWQDGNIFF